MSTPSRGPLLAPFQVRSFRFQWPADLATSWAFEMETIILGWYVLVETGSVLLLSIFGSLQFLGTLIAPLLGLIGDRVGHRNLLCAMRALYAALAATLMTLAFTGVLNAAGVFVIAAVMGIVRPSDLVMRNALIGETMPASLLTGAVSLSRMTADTARIAGALAGAGLVATLGMGAAYVVIASLYAGSCLLTVGVAGVVPRFGSAAHAAAAPVSAWRDLREGVASIWDTPPQLAAMCLAFLVNLTAYPFSNGLLPYVASQVYRVDQTGLGYLVASFAFGGLLGAIVLSRISAIMRPGRMMIVFGAVWYLILMVFAQSETARDGMIILVIAGFMQNMCLVPMSVLLLRSSSPQLRGRVMGMRMLAVYGLPLGLLAAGPLIQLFGFAAAATMYGAVGLLFVLVILIQWRPHLWPADASANMR